MQIAVHQYRYVTDLTLDAASFSSMYKLNDVGYRHITIYLLLLSSIFDVLDLRCIERQTVAARSLCGIQVKRSSCRLPSLLARGPSQVWSSPACV